MGLLMTKRTIVVVATATWLMGCYGGSITDSLDSIRDRDLSGVAGPPDMGAVQPVERIDRAMFGSAAEADALTFSSLAEQHKAALFDVADSDTPLYLFVTPRVAADGLGPLFNQTHCLGCHANTRDNAAIATSVDIGELMTSLTPVARGSRTASNELEMGADVASSAFTVFGDYHVADARFDGLESLGGPVQQRGAADGCFGDSLPGETAPSPSAIRQTGERSAPSYVGRGLIEAIYDGDIERQADPDDRLSSISTLVPAAGCTGDCISGRANLNTPASALVGGDPIQRVGRFGLRAASTTLLEVVAAGAQRDVGLTNPFLPIEEQNPYNAGLACDIAADPELTAAQILAMRDLIRNLAPPEMSKELLDASRDDAKSRDVRAGARLFGVDLDAFRSRMIEGEDASRFGDEWADRGVAMDRQLNCVGCHTPIMVAGRSPAKIGGEQLSDRWVPLFSDLLIHDMGAFPLQIDRMIVQDSHAFFKGVSRNLADFALPAQGLARGEEWRTAPLLAFGKVGPPYLHDARVFLNPSAPAYFYYGSRTADEAQLDSEARRVEIVDVPSAIQAAIELHDLPQPPDRDLDGLPDYASCPVLDPAIDWCSRQSPFRSEARNVLEKWHGLSDVEQRQVIAFLEAL